MIRYGELKQYLEDEPRARERKNKDRAIVNLLLKKYPFLETIKKDVLVEICHEFTTLDRAWRRCTRENPELRGKDWEDGQKLSEEYQINLGYTPHYHEDLKKLENI